MLNLINKILEEIRQQYLEDDNKIPWIIGFSGGKDSTMLLQLVWYAIKEYPKELWQRNIYVVCNDTLVENPKIVEYTNGVLDKIQIAAFEQSIPIYVIKTTPKLEDTFWVNLIGKGYPAPNNAFRWCTERLKINPTTEFIKSKISEVGQAIILLGTRKEESTARAASINNHTKEGTRLRKHILPNAFVFSPIQDIKVSELWQYLNQVKSPWGADNKQLNALYRNANGGDCPLVIDDTTPSCGNSRFGCWVCTVVNRDKSMEALIQNGEEWMEPLMEIRDLLANNRNNPEWRETTRRDGSNGIGPYKPIKRAEILETLLRAQKEIKQTDPTLSLINYQELIAIQVTWYRDSIFNQSVAEIYNRVNGTEFSDNDFKDQLIFEKQLLKEVCAEYPTDINLIEELLELQRTKILLVKSRGLHNDLENRLEKFIKSSKKEDQYVN
jgi:DNA sulfur modification protein DndC